MKSTVESDVKAISCDEHAVSPLPPATGSTTINVGTSERIVSVLGGAALTVLGIRNITSKTGIGMFLSGAYLLARGISGYCAVSNMLGRNTVHTNPSAMEVTSTFIVDKHKWEVYAYWRKVDNLPNFMKHLKEVRELDEKTSHWTAEVPGGLGTVSWDAGIIEDTFGEFISWTSLPGSTIDNAGHVSFKDAGNGSTEVQACISYRLPAGQLGSIAGKLFNPAVKQMIKEDLQRFKNILETDESPVSERSASEENKGGSDSQPYENPVYQGA